MTIEELERLSKAVNALSTEEKRLIALLRSLQHGHVTIFVRNGVPYRVEEGIRSVVLS